MKLNRSGYAHARRLIEDGLVVFDDRDEWSEHQPSAADENRFIEQHGIDEFAKWHLGVDETKAPNTKGRYAFPFGDFEKVHRCGLLAAESRAGQYKYLDIQRAVAHLHGMVEASGRRRGAAR
jgi:hypothetical protein